MRIEDITEEKLKNLDSSRLGALRSNINQLWNKYFKGNADKVIGVLSREDLIAKYKILMKVIQDRNIRQKNITDLDYYLFEKPIYNFSIADLGEVIITPEYISLAGSYVRDPLGASDVDIILRHPEGFRDESLELKLGRELQKVFEKSIEFVYHQAGPHSTYIPLYHLVLRPVEKFKKEIIKDKVSKQLEATEEDMKEERREHEYFYRLDQWDESRIHESGAVIERLSAGSILDLGCGTGKLLKYLSNGGRKVFGIDSSVTALSMAKGKNIEVLEHDLNEEIPFNTNSFNNVISLHTLEHLKKPDVMIAEAQRIAKDRVILIVPLGERFCPEHKNKYDTAEDLKKLLPDPEWIVEEIQYNNALAFYEKPERLSKALKPLQKFKPMKFSPATGYTESEFFNFEKWADWAKKYLEEGGVDLEIKFNGYHTVLQANEKGDSLVYFEDTMADKSKILPDLAEELSSIGKAVILDSDIGMRSKTGELLPRVDLAILAQTKTPIKGWWKHPKRPSPEAKLEAHVYDILYYDNQDIHDEPWETRRAALEKLFGAHDFKFMKLVPKNVVKSRAQFIATAKKLSGLPGSEGAVAKWTKFKYPIYPKMTPAVSKFKKSLEIKFEVLSVVPTKTSGTVNLEIGYLHKGKLESAGKTFNTKLKAKRGDIVTITVDEVIPVKEKDEWKLSFVAPIVQDLETAWTKAEDSKSILRRATKKGVLQANEEVRRELGIKKIHEKAEREREGAGGQFGNIDFKIGTKGRGIMQIHIMGIEEKKVELLQKKTKRIQGARAELGKLESLLKGILGERGAHLDIRLRPKDEGYWEGGEVMIGNLSGLSKIKGLEKGKKLLFGWKQSRADEKKTEVVRGPLSWLGIGDRKIEIFAPGEVGATANKYGAMMILDKFDWEIYVADDHAKKIRFKNHHLDGNYLFAFVPVGEGERKWMLSKLKDEDYEEEKEQKKTEKSEQYVPIFKISEDEQIVGGIVYEPMKQDTQGDYATEKDIQEACYYFMEHTLKFKVMHKGNFITNKVRILENYIAPSDMVIENQKVKKGSWIIVLRILDKKIWKEVKEGKLTGFSMAGIARRRPTKTIKE